MAVGPTRLARAMRSVADAWPADPFRPNLQLKQLFRHLADHPNLNAGAVHAAIALRQGVMAKKVRNYHIRSNVKIEPELYIFLFPPAIGSSISQYPLSQKIMRPASRPYHYERLVEAF